MSKVRVAGFSLSLDGFGAGPRQSLEDPLGQGGEQLHQWLFPTRTFQKMFGKGHGTEGLDEKYAARSMDNFGAFILGRNMFGPVRGPWPDESWRGWWGETPPYHVPVFVLTHHQRAPLEMDGGTIFHFVTGGILDALDRARQAAAGRDIRVGGGASTIRQYLEADLIDEMHLVVSPILLGSGEPLFAGIDLKGRGFEVTEQVPTDKAMHVVLEKRS